jgi:hypothetical protein
MARTSGNIVTFIFIMTVTNNGKNKLYHWHFYLYNDGHQQWEEQVTTLTLLSLWWWSPTMARTSGNIVTFIFIMTVTNNGKNKW